MPLVVVTFWVLAGELNTVSAKHTCDKKLLSWRLTLGMMLNMSLLFLGSSFSEAASLDHVSRDSPQSVSFQPSSAHLTSNPPAATYFMLLKFSAVEVVHIFTCVESKLSKPSDVYKESPAAALLVRFG